MILEKKHTEHYVDHFRIRTYDAGFNRMASPIALLGFMQELATNHAEKLGIGYHDSMDNGYFWVLRSARYELIKVPKLDDILELHTWPAGVDGLKALRRFEFYVEGELIGKGYHYWLMFDKDKRTPIISDYFLQKTSHIPVTEEDYYKIPRIAPLHKKELAYTTSVRNKDIDWNHHMNNVRYIDFIFDSLPYDFIEREEIISFQIDYLKELSINQEVQIYTCDEKSKVLVEGLADCKIVFRSAIYAK